MRILNSLVLALSVAALSAPYFQNQITRVETKVMQFASMPTGGWRNPSGCLRASMPTGGWRNPSGCLRASMPTGGWRNPSGCLRASMPTGGWRNPSGCLKASFA